MSIKLKVDLDKGDVFGRAFALQVGLFWTATDGPYYFRIEMFIVLHITETASSEPDCRWTKIVCGATILFSSVGPQRQTQQPPDKPRPHFHPKLRNPKNGEVERRLRPRKDQSAACQCICHDEALF